MQNAAYQLADIFERMALVQNTEPLRTREVLAQEVELDMQRHTSEVMSLVRSLDITLSGMAQTGFDVDAWLRLVPFWYDAVLMPASNWAVNSTASAPALSPDHLGALRMLGAFLAATGPGPLDDSRVERMPDLLTELHELIEESNLKPAGNAYLLGLAAQIQHVLKYGDSYGDELLRRATIELAGALNIVAASDDVQPEQSERFRKLATWFALTVFTPAVAVFGQLSASYVQDQLGPKSHQPPPVVEILEAPPHDKQPPHH